MGILLVAILLAWCLGIVLIFIFAGKFHVDSGYETYKLERDRILYSRSKNKH